MRALVKTAPGPGLELIEIPEPECGPDQVKLRVLRAGLCGTDLHLESWDDWAASAVNAPLTPGHEFYGEVVEIGPLVRDIKVGDRVSGEGHIVCGTCRNCRAGRRHMCIRTSSIGVDRDGAAEAVGGVGRVAVFEVEGAEVVPGLGVVGVGGDGGGVGAAGGFWVAELLEDLAEAVVGVQHAHDPRPVRAGLAVDQGRIFDLVEQFLGAQNSSPRRHFTRGHHEVDHLQAEPVAGVLLQGVEAAVEPAAQVDHGLDAAVLPPLQLERPRLVGAHQLGRDPVRVLEAHAQIGVVVP